MTMQEGFVAMVKPIRRLMLLVAMLAATAAVLSACGETNATETTAAAGGDATTTGSSAIQLAGDILIDGSSTVFPITEAVAEEFQQLYPDVRVSVGISGTGGGFKKFYANETAISDASRPIKQEEADNAAANGVEFIELPVAFDGLSVMVNPENDWVDFLTVEELKKIWEPEAQGKITKWNQIRPDWPDEEIRLYGAGTDSGTFDYFTDAIVGEEGASRGDFTASEDDNVLVQGIAGDKNALGFFGFAYYEGNKDKLKLVPIVSPETNQPITPSPETINNGSYQPLSRPIFIYVNTEAAGRPEVEEFVKFYLAEAPVLVPEVGYVALPDEIYQLAMERFELRTTGSVFAGGSQVGVTLKDLLDKE